MKLNNSVAAIIKGAKNSQMFIHGITSNVEHVVMELAGTPAFPDDTCYCHSTGARLGASAPAKTWADIVCHKGKSSKKSHESINTHSATQTLTAKQV